MAPDRPLGGQVVPNTGGSWVCSTERSRGHFSGCSLGVLPVRAGERRVEPLARHRRAVGGVEVGTPAGDARAQRVAVLGERRLVRCVGHDEFLPGHAALGTTIGLMQSSSLAENMW